SAPAPEGAVLSCRNRPAVCEVGSAGGFSMSAYRQGEFHAFEGGGQNYLYLVPSAAIFALEDLSAAVLDLLKHRELTKEQIVAELIERGHSRSIIEET